MCFKGFNKKEYSVMVRETRRLYEVEGHSLTEISGRLGITRQAVHKRLINAGVEMRPAHPKLKTLPRQPLERLYVQERKTSAVIAAELGVSLSLVHTSLRRHGITVRKSGRIQPDWTPKFESLKIGESLTLPRPVCRGKWQSYFYGAAWKRGIKVSVRAIDDNNVLVTRKA